MRRIRACPSHARRPRGFTLVEVMVAMTLGLLVVAATLSLYAATVDASRRALLRARLTHDLHTTTAVITRHLRRAGYWGRAGASGPNPFATGAGALAVGAGGACVRFSYDADHDGVRDDGGAGGAAEHYGFRWNRRLGTVQMLAGGTGTCTGGRGWQSLTDPALLEITGLRFTLVEAPAADAAGWVTRAVRFRLAVRLRGRAEATRAVAGTVAVRNHRRGAP